MKFSKLAATLAMACLALAGCSANRKPLFNIDQDGQAQAFKRYTGRPAVDYLFRWNKKAFRKVEDPFKPVSSADVDDVIKRHGAPDYYRTDVKAEGNEYFDEWVYWDENTIVQFIDGKLVFEGGLLDSDRYLVRSGFPASAYSQQYEHGPRREFWIYDHLFEIGDETVSFSDGKLVYRSVN